MLSVYDTQCIDIGTTQSNKHCMYISTKAFIAENSILNLMYCRINCTEWFKINLRLFKSHISDKWDDIMNLFEDINCYILGKCGESGIKIDVQVTEMVVLFGQIT